MACFLLFLSSSLPIEASEPVILSAAGAKDLLVSAAGAIGGGYGVKTG